MSSFPLHPEITFIGETTYRNSRQRFGIKRDDRRRHMYLIGKTGMGKSTMIENLVIQDIYNGQGVALVDPHGDLVEKVIKVIPPNRVDDVIYFNPSDMDYPIAFNVVEKVSPEYRHLVASGLVGVFKKIWADSWGPRLEYLLRNVILALLDYQDTTLLGIPRMFVDNTFRKKVIAKVQDPVVKAFWVDEFSKYNQQFLTEAISPIQNKVGQFLSSSLIRNVIGQNSSSFNIREAMDQQKIILLNLSKGRIGEDNAALLGAMMITKIQLAAMSRVDIEEETRKDFYLYVDEFQNFATESFAGILSEARKYRLNLIIAHQYIEQLGDVVKAAVFGNVGTMICYRVGAGDADELVKEFTPQYTEEDLVNNPKYNCYLRLMIDGIASEPFSAQGLPPITGNTGQVQAVIDATRAKYANKRTDVEQAIRDWSGMSTPEEQGAADDEKKRKKRNKKKIKKIEKLLPEYEQLARLGNHEAKEVVEKLTQAMVDLSEDKDVDIGDIVGREDEFDEDGNDKSLETKQTSKTAETNNSRKPSQNKNASNKKSDKKRYEITCDECGKTDTVPFNPDPNKPIYCFDCMQKRKAEKKDKPSKPKRDENKKNSAPKPKLEQKNKESFIPVEPPIDSSEGVSLKDLQKKKVQLQHGSPKKEMDTTGQDTKNEKKEVPKQSLQPGQTVKLSKEN